jgi:site-specific recombinase
MHDAVKRVVVYLVISATAYAIAVFFVDSQPAFIGVFGFGLLVGLVAEILFWFHLIRLPWARKRR